MRVAVETGKGSWKAVRCRSHSDRSARDAVRASGGRWCGAQRRSQRQIQSQGFAASKLGPRSGSGCRATARFREGSTTGHTTQIRLGHCGWRAAVTTLAYLGGGHRQCDATLIRVQRMSDRPAAALPSQSGVARSIRLRQRSHQGDGSRGNRAVRQGHMHALAPRTVKRMRAMHSH